MGESKKQKDYRRTLFCQFYNVSDIKRIHLGMLSYGQWYIKQDIEDGLLSVEPIIKIVLPYRFNILVIIRKELFHKGRYISIFRLGYRIFVRDQNKPINFGI
jgi:hypothetical protein